MTRHLTPDTRLETLRKEAKRWLKALRAQNQTARDRFNHAYADASQQPSLRDVQHALAREHGLADWVALKAAVAEAALAGRGREERLAEFLEHARLRYGIRPGTGKWEETYSDDPGRWSYAARILERHPQIVAGNIHAAAVSGDLEEVRRILRERPAAALEAPRSMARSRLTTSATAACRSPRPATTVWRSPLHCWMRGRRLNTPSPRTTAPSSSR